MGTLNPKQVENLTGDDVGTYDDGDGHRLTVRATGRKSWVLQLSTSWSPSRNGTRGAPWHHA
jgi:hypothetical protein